MSLLRYSAERVARIPFIKIWRSLPSPFSSIRVCVTPDSSLKFVLPGNAAFDLDLLAFVQKFIKPGSCVWDIGANLGIFTFSAASLAGPNGRIVAVEPDPKLASLLRRSSSAQPDSSAQTEVLQAAVSSTSGSAEFQIAARGRAANALSSVPGSNQMGGVRKELSVECITLDDLLQRFRPPDLIKLDIEGAELSALKGGEKILNTIRPSIYCEMGMGPLLSNSLAIMDVLNGSNYWLFNPNKPIEDKMRLSPISNSDRTDAHVDRTRLPFNVLAIPQEKMTKSN